MDHVRYCARNQTRTPIGGILSQTDCTSNYAQPVRSFASRPLPRGLFSPRVKENPADDPAGFSIVYWLSNKITTSDFRLLWYRIWAIDPDEVFGLARWA